MGMIKLDPIGLTRCSSRATARSVQQLASTSLSLFVVSAVLSIRTVNERPIRIDSILPFESMPSAIGCYLDVLFKNKFVSLVAPEVRTINWRYAM